MANWCSCEITFYSENKEALAQFARLFNEIHEGQSTEENGFGHGWMGDYANIFYPNINAKNIDCRGFIAYMDSSISIVEKYFVFTICTETAWDAKMGLWASILKDFFPDIKMAYVAEECGCAYYCKYDETGLFYPHDYYVDIAYPGDNGDIAYIDEHGFTTVQEIHKWFDDYLPFKYEKKDDAYELKQEITSKLNELDSDEFYYCTIEKYEEISPSDFQLKI